MANMGMHHAVGPPQSDDQNILNGAGYANQNAGYVGQQQQLPVGYPNQNAPGPQGYGGQQQQQQQPTPPAGYQQPPQQPGYPPPQSSPSAYLPPQASPYGLPPSASPFPPPAGQQNQYGPPPQQQSPYGTGDVGSLSQAMSQVDLSGQQPGTISKASRKKGRAYHQLDQAPEQAGLGAGNNFPPFTPNVGDNMQQGFLDADPSSMAMGPQPHTGSQFPMPGAPAFAPQQQVDPTAFHARMGGPAKGMPAMGGKIDPLAIPSIPVSRDMALQHYRKTMFPTLARQLPPNATSDFIAQDQGNASPRVCRLTLNAVPVSGELLATTHLPLALLIQPLAKLKPEEVPIPVLDFGESGPPRCRRCRTYMNPFMQFVHGGGKFRCNMCLFPNNEVPNEYYSPVDMAGVRVDRDQRPELTRGTVEFVVPKEYWAKKGSAEAIGDGKGGAPMRWLFLIDVTETAVNRGTLEAVVGGIKEALYGASAYENILPGEEEQDGREGMKRRLPAGCKVGICTLDKEVHFYNLSPNLDQAQMVVMPDIEEPFVPFHDGLFVDPYEARSVIEPLLDSLPRLFVHIKNPEPALLPALTASLLALEKTGGKIICSLSTLPTWGPDRLMLRDDSKIYNTEKEKMLFKTDNPAWRTCAGKMVEAGVGVDFFITPSAYVDIATIGHVSATTGGETFFYPNFVKDRDSKKLEDELSHAFHRGAGYQALMKVRCSNGLQVASYHGNFLQMGPSSADIEFGVIDEDKAIAVMFSHDGKLDPKVDAHFQSALLYTTKSGERRVRCSNVVAAVTEVARDAVRWADQDAVIGVLAREAASRMIEKPLKDIRGALTEKCVEILAAYRKHCASSNNPPGQLVLPESLKEFSMYVLALLKIRALRGGNVSSDLRTHSMRMLKSMSAPELQLYLYPRIVPIHNMSAEDGFAEPSGHLKIPTAMRASFGFVEEGGAYLVDNGQYLLLWIHTHVSPNLLEDLFGEGHDSLQSLDPMMSEFPVLDTALNCQVRNVVQYLGSLRGSNKVSIQIARQGIDGAEYEFANALIEDRNAEEKSYVDWLVHVHKYVQLEVTPSARGG